MAGEAVLFRDLAIVLLAAGVTALLFYSLKQPVVLGYLLAGFIVGPFSPGPSFVSDSEVMGFLGELGIVFLLFALGLEFSLSKLRKVGATAILAGTMEIAIMLFLGYGLGRALGWTPMEAVFLGAIMSISSTTIIVKVLAERGQKDEEWAQLAFGILIMEDILAVLILTGLSSAGATGNFQPELIGGLLGKLAVFLGAALVLGLLAAPRIVDKLAVLKVEEVMVVVAVGIGFGMALLAESLGFSAGLGAFIAGALMAESPRVAKIGHKIEPLRDVFTAIFFVTVGAALNPGALAASWFPIILVAIGVVVGKVLAISLATFILGEPPGKAVRVGMAMAQIGEFAFIIAALGTSLGVVPPSLYPIAIAVSAATAFLTPYLIRGSPAIIAWLAQRVPPGFHAYGATYGSWVNRMHRTDREDPEWRLVRANALKAALAGTVIVAIFALGGVAVDSLRATLGGNLPVLFGLVSLEYIALATLAVPFFLFAFQSMRTLVQSLARLAVPQRLRSAECTSTERLLRRTFGLGATILGGAFCVILLGSFVDSVLYVLIPATGAVVLSSVFLGRSLGGFNREVERTLARVLSGEEQPGSRDEVIQRLESARAWGADSREVTLPAVSGAGGRTIAQLRLRELTGASILDVRRGRGRVTKRVEPAPDLLFEAGDQVLLVGEDAALTRAEEILVGRDLGVPGGASEFEIVAASPYAGRTLTDAGLTMDRDVLVLLVRRGAALMPALDDPRLQAGDVIVVSGTEEKVRQVGQHALGQAVKLAVGDNARYD